MKKKFISLLFLCLIVALIFPVANLIIKPDNSGLISRLQAADASFKTVASVFEDKCAGCHIPDADLPFYAGLPVASGMMGQDIERGLRFFDMKESFSSDDGAAPEPALAKIERIVEKGSMPPHRYLALHWDAGISAEDQAILFDWIHSIRDNHYATAGVAAEFKHEPVQPLAVPKVTNPQLVSLGDRLYHDNRLSGDDSLSCATCHALDMGGTDQLRYSEGIDGQFGDINAPTTFNAGFAIRQFWDGRAADLKEQAGGPVTNPIEMGAEWPAVITKLEADTDYVRAFDALFKDGINNNNIQEAIAAFEETLVTVNAPFDQYLYGKKDAITPTQQEGYHLFKDHGCATCHVGKILGGQSFEYMGLWHDYFADRGEVIKPDHGLYNFSGEEKDRHKFKVPTLRNVTLTFPYFHDGTTSDLAEAVRIMGKYQTESGLSEDEVVKITGFLETLTGEYKGKRL